MNCVIFQHLKVNIFYILFFVLLANAQPTTELDTLTNSPSKIFQAEEVIVHSTRIQTNTDVSVFPLSVVKSKNLLQQPHVTVSEVLKRSPGISLIRDGSWETAISIRGMGRSNIVTLVDNVRIETANDIAGALSLINVYDLERIETIRSSGAALYGTGALGGIVQFMTKQPAFTEQSQVSGEFSSGISSVNNLTGQYLALQNSSDRYAFRLSGGYRKADNTTTPSGILNNSQFMDFNFNGSLGIKTFEDQTLRLSYQRSQAENAGIPGGSPFPATAVATYKLARRELFGFEYTIPNIYPDVYHLTFRASHQNIIRNVELIASPVITQTPHAIHATTTAQIESRIAPLTNDVLVFGAEVWQRDLVSKRERINKSAKTITGERPVPHSTFLSTGIYAQNEWSFIPDKARIIFGARYDWINIENDETFNPEYVDSAGIHQTAPAIQKLLWKAGSAKNNSWSANAGIQYSLLSSLDVSLLASTAFRSPSLEERYQFLDLGNIVRVGNPDLKPEQSVSINAGLNFHLEQTKIHADLFLNDLTNLVTDVPGLFEGRNASYKQNIGKARLYGYEIAAEHPVTNWSLIRCTASYVRGEDTRNHTNLPQIVPLNGNIEAIVFLQKAGTLTLCSSMSATHHNLASGEFRTSGYTVFDIDGATVPFMIQQFSISVRGGVQNILDKEYQNHLSTLRGIIKSEPGRNFFLSVMVAV